MKQQLGMEPEKTLIVGCGLGMPFRKGADLFIQLGDALLQRGRDDVHLYWIGGFDESESDAKHGKWANHQKKLVQDGLGKSITFLGYKENFRDYFQVADIFVLPSLEDPFPLVAVEAAKCGLPIVCFEDAGGTPDLVGDDAGFIVPFENVEAMADKITTLIENVSIRIKMGNRAREKFLSHFTIERTTPNILATCRKIANKKPAVTVIVPNYNHAHYLPQRLDSIFNQTFQDFEVILLDDASSDNSLSVLNRYSDYGDVRILRNDYNTGSPFKQWLKGIDLARADILWIAESDDVCEPLFLETLLPAFQDRNLKLAYVNSYVINEDSEVVGDYTNTEYLTSLSPIKWKTSYRVSANQEINDGLGVKNTILNVSAVLFRKFELDHELRKSLQEMHIAGDWFFMIHAIKNGEILYNAKKLNYHRRHSESVIGKVLLDKKIEGFFREFHVIQSYIFNNFNLSAGFQEKWEKYLRQQWNDFCPDRSFNELKNYYPLDEMRKLISNANHPESVQTDHP